LAARDQLLLRSRKCVSDVWVGCVCQRLVKQLIYAMEVVARHAALSPQYRYKSTGAGFFRYCGIKPDSRTLASEANLSSGDDAIPVRPIRL